MDSLTVNGWYWPPWTRVGRALDRGELHRQSVFAAGSVCDRREIDDMPLSDAREMGLTSNPCQLCFRRDAQWTA